MTQVIDRPATATANAAGIATATIANDSAGQIWTVNQMTVITTSVAATTANVYKNLVGTSALIVSAYLTGNNDSSVGDTIILNPGDTILCQWVGADPGAVCTFRLQASTTAL